MRDGQDNGVMSDAAPPAAARPGGRAAARRVLAVLLQAPLSRRARAEAVYCVAALPLGAAGFAIIVALLTAGTVLCVTIVGAVAGLLLLVAVLRAARGLGSGHRRLAGALLGERVRAPARFTPGTGVLGRLDARLRDGTGWRAVAYLLLRLPTAILGGYLVAYLWLGGLFYLTYPLWWGIFQREPDRARGTRQPNAITTFPLGPRHAISLSGTLLVAGLGAVALLIAPWAVRALVLADRWLMRNLLGPGRMSERVATLEQTRAAAVDASAAMLRQVERNLHDGAQVQLAALAMSLGMAREKLGDSGEPLDLGRARELVDSAHRSAKEALVELRGLARGIHPPVLDAGLADALATLAARSAVPVDVSVDVIVRPTAAIETIAYFCTAELLANIAKHSGARHAAIAVADHDGALRLAVTDDGTGGADAAGGTGLAGLAQRVRTVDGQLSISSPAGGPTVVTIDLPSHA
jgi:hypothetical protein